MRRGPSLPGWRATRLMALAAAALLAAGPAAAQEQASVPQDGSQQVVAPGTEGSAGGAASRARIVLSGAHPGFDRLVVPLAPGERWQVRRDGEDHLFSVIPATRGAPPPAFALDRVFARIGRARLQAIATAPQGALRLTLGCDCALATFTESGAWVAIDIADLAGPAPPRPRPAPRATAALPPAPSLTPDLPLDLPLRSERPLPLSPFAVPPTEGEAPADLSPALAAASPGQADPEEQHGTGPDARAALRTRVEMAIAEGLLVPARRPALPAPPPLPVPVADDAAHHLSMRSALDPEPAPDSPPATPACPDPADLDVAAWGGAGPPARQIAAARGNLLGEFDHPLPGAALALARLYVHHGLGAEALAVLAAFPDPSPAAAAVAALARVMEDPDGSRELLPPSEPGCPGNAALWDIFRAENPATLGESRLQEAVGLFTALPAHLRRQLGPVATRRLAAAGRDEAAALVHAATIRAEPRRAEHASGAPDDLLAVEALLEQAEGLLDAGAPMPPRLRETLAAYAFEFSRHPLGGRLAAATIRADAADGAHSQAYDAWEDAEGPGPPEVPLPGGLAGALLDSLTATAPPETLATVFFRHRERVLAGADGGVRRRALARRLLEAGLAPEAAAVLGSAPDEDAAQPEDRLLAARIALARGRTVVARALLDGLDTREALALRLQAEMAAGAFAEAQRTARALGDPEAIAQADWRAGDQAEAAVSAGQSHRAALAAAVPSAPLAGPSLGDSRAAIARSRETRAALERLLANPDPRPDDADPPAVEPAALTESQDLTRR